MTDPIHSVDDCPYAPEDTFVCPECDRLCCACARGADDDDPDLCDDCWYAKYYAEEQADV